MPENLAKEIEERNKKYLEGLQGNIGKYVFIDNGAFPQIRSERFGKFRTGSTGGIYGGDR